MLLFVSSVVTSAVPKSSHFGMATATIYDFITRLRPIMIITLSKDTSIGYNDTPMPHLTRRKQSLVKSSIKKSLFFVGSHFKKID
tara:strand:- start:2049 stop:2303 length:255 start_codon:yes stop_codon:yes gene_type:complete